MRLFRVLLPFLLVSLLVAHARAAAFDPARDVLGFANETYFEYVVGANGQVTFHKRSVEEENLYSRHCFVMVRSVLQFHHGAEFRPDLPKVSDAEYARLIQRVSRIPAWSTGRRKKIVVPGYADLWSFSAAHPYLCQLNLGAWWPSFWRVGNWRIVLPVPRAGQARTARWFQKRLDEGRIEGVYLTRFRPLNHCMIVYGYRVQPNGEVLFSAYDPNQPKVRPTLRYSPGDRSFTLDKTWYWGGGRVTALRLYLSPAI